MRILGQALSTRSLSLFSLGMIFLSLQGCHYVKPQPPIPSPITEDEDRGPILAVGDNGDCGAKGCNSTGYTSSAQGFVGVGGTNPVPAGYTCNTGSVKCSKENSTGCSMRHPKKKCRTTFTYQSGSKTGPCSCDCIY